MGGAGWKLGVRTPAFFAWWPLGFNLDLHDALGRVRCHSIASRSPMFFLIVRPSRFCFAMCSFALSLLLCLLLGTEHNQDQLAAERIWCINRSYSPRIPNPAMNCQDSLGPSILCQRRQQPSRCWVVACR